MPIPAPALRHLSAPADKAPSRSGESQNRRERAARDAREEGGCAMRDKSVGGRGVSAVRGAGQSVCGKRSTKIKLAMCTRASARMTRGAQANRMLI